jgi:hypothetical protein
VTSRIRATGPRVRAALIWALLFLVYTSTLGLDAFLDSDYGGDEPHYLLATQSLVEDGDLDVLDDYRAEEYEGFYPFELDMHGAPRDGSLHEPHGAGFPVMIGPAFALGAAVGVELLLAAIAAACVALAYLLARRVTDDPWALGAALAVGLSPPFVAYGTAVYPDLAAGAALAAGALLVLRLSDHPSAGPAVGCAALIAALPWLGTKFVPAGVVMGFFAVRALRRGGRRLLAVAGLQVVAIGTIAYVLVNQALYGGATPYAADFDGESATDAAFPAGYLERAYRLAALLVDREYGLLRWAPVFALALAAAWHLLRGRGARAPRGAASTSGAMTTSGSIATSGAITSGGASRWQMADGRWQQHRTAVALCGSALAAQVFVAAFLAPTMFGFWFPPRHLLAALPLAVPLVALGLHRLPRVGAALAAVGVVASVWVWLAVRLGDAGLAADRPGAPFGPLDAAFPLYGQSPLPYLLTAAAAAALLVLVARAYADRARAAARHARHTAGVTRRRYSG